MVLTGIYDHHLFLIVVDVSDNTIMNPCPKYTENESNASLWVSIVSSAFSVLGSLATMLFLHFFQKTRTEIYVANPTSADAGSERTLVTKRRQKPVSIRLIFYLR